LAGGVCSVHSLAHQETFHPVIGPVAEAEALYVRQLNLVERVRAHHGEFVIWDIGLGAAANSLTVLRALSHVPARVRLVSFDLTLEPLRFALDHAEQLGYFHGFETSVKTLLSKRAVQINRPQQQVDWQLHLGDFPALLGEPRASSWPKPDAILFDAFSPAKNPAMWTLPLFSALFRLLEPSRPCVLPTYSRSTMLRVTLLLAGFYVGTGHATGEKEETTLAANTPSLISEPLDAKWLPRVRQSTSAEPLCEPVYRQRPLSESAWEKLRQHPQFKNALKP
jgi:tRNA U34 5-methylaminomethyl-2-thiouridine-forming methyltransferase MnmC